MTIQILHYEFLGPIKLNEWGPPMEKVVYLILSRNQDKFNIIYAGDCEKTEDPGFFTKNPDFKCWLTKGGSEKFLYIAILPLFDSESSQRKNILNKIILRYDPPCNPEIQSETPPYQIKSSSAEPEPQPEHEPELASPEHEPELASPEHEPEQNTNDEGINTCPKCGGKMKLDQVLATVVVFRCSQCGTRKQNFNL